MKDNNTFLIFFICFVVWVVIMVFAGLYNQANLDSSKCPEKGFVYTSFLGTFEECVFNNEVYIRETIGVNYTMEVYNG